MTEQLGKGDSLIIGDPWGGDQFVNVITQEKPPGDHIFLDGVIDKAFLKLHIKDFGQSFYVCEPDPFNKSIMAALEELGANPDALIFEN